VAASLRSQQAETRALRENLLKGAGLPLTLVVFYESQRHSRLLECRIMNWIALLGIVVVIVALAALTGIKPKGTRSIAHSRLMTVGWIILLVIVVIIAWMVF